MKKYTLIFCLVLLAITTYLPFHAEAVQCNITGFSISPSTYNSPSQIPTTLTANWNVNNACERVQVCGENCISDAAGSSASWPNVNGPRTYSIVGYVYDENNNEVVGSSRTATFTYNGPTSATISTSQGASCAGGSWVISGGGETFGGSPASVTATGGYISGGGSATYSISYTPPSGYTYSVSPAASQLVTAGSAYSFAVTCTAPQASQPTASISANPTSLQCTEPLSTATISWSSMDATSCTGTGFSTGGATSGSVSVTPSGSTSGTTNNSYSIQCTGPGGNSSVVSTSVNVAQCTAPQASVTLSANPSSVSSGGASTLSWSGTNISSCSAWWTSSTNTSGSQSVSPVTTTNYTINCTATGAAGGGTVSSSATVTVAPSGSAPVVSISANPTSGTVDLINPTITWNVSNTPTSCVASGDWSGSKAASGSSVMGTLSQARTYTYSLNCSNASGAGSGSASVVVNPPATGISVTTNNGSASWTINPGNITGSGFGGTWTNVAPGVYTITPGTIPNYTSTVSNSDGGGASITLSTGERGTFTLSYSTTGSSVDYSLSNSGNLTITKDGADVFGTESITRNLISGTQAPTSLAITSTLPSGVSASISNNPCTATCSSTITFTVTQNAQTGTFPVTVTGTQAGAPTHTTPFNLTINPSPDVTVSCQASPSPAIVGQPVTWTAYPSGGTAPYTYAWVGTDFPSSPPTTNPYNFTYQTTGSKTARVTVRDNNGAGVAQQCAVTQLQVNVNPSFKEF